MKATRILVVTSWLLGSCFNPAFAQDAKNSDSADDSERKALVYLWTARELDGKCHALTTDERKTVDIQIDLMLKDLKIAADEMKRKMGTSPASDIKCDDKVAQLLFEMAKDAKAAPSRPAAAKEDDQETDDQKDWEFVQESWKKNFQELPSGRLGAFEGCWKGKVGQVLAEMCLSKKGDQAAFHLGEPSSLHCDFSGGGARRKDERVMFFVPSDNRKCSDSSVVQHVEGACKPISDTEMQCVLSIYSKGNDIYRTSDGQLMNGGDVTLTRVKQ